MDGLRAVLQEAEGRRTIVVTDGVFGWRYRTTDELVKLAKEFGAIVMVDDAHASGF